MYCSKCNKNLMVGKVLCRDCANDFERVPDANTRIGYYARHPEALSKLLLQTNSGDDLGLSVCQRDCTADPDADVDCTNEKFASCITRWLMEPIKEVPQHETKS